MGSIDLKRMRGQYKYKYDSFKRETLFKRDNYRCYYCNKKLLSWSGLIKLADRCMKKLLDKSYKGIISDEEFQKSSPYRTLIYSKFYFYQSATLDHVIPLSKGGLNEDNNLVTCCRSCNSTKRAS